MTVAPSAVKNAARKWLLLRFGRTAYLHTEDRRVLETVILPDLAARPDIRNVLSVGCAWYTEGYERFFHGRGRAFWTLDIEQSVARFGASGGRHVVAPAEEVTAHFAPGSLDLVLCNGVLGWGLNEPAAIDAALAGFFTCLRPGGPLLLGWNDVPDNRPPEDPAAAARRAGFVPAPYAPLGGAVRYPVPGTDNAHTFDFLARP